MYLTIYYMATFLQLNMEGIQQSWDFSLTYRIHSSRDYPITRHLSSLRNDVSSVLTTAVVFNLGVITP